MKVSFEKIDKALKQLTDSLQNLPLSDLERDGVIQRFEYTIELLWKVAKKVLQENGIITVAPKEVIKEMANIGWINNPEEFLDYLKARNETSHSYEESKAQETYEVAKKFAIACSHLITILKEKSK
ncbi:MAG: nucleotidyltransferase substrate binding protein [Bacteriovoracaceae bacterium]|nr:nucleotidyltransferase substrate binding protein [Bacteriovoracaceae bacterium]